MDINRDDYLFMTVTWKGGFTHIVPCRGYNLKSQIQFTKSLFWVETFTWRVVSKEDYEERIWGSGSAADTEKTTLTSTTRPRSKNGQSGKTDGKKPSRTKQSVKPATKTTKKKASSSTTTRKQTSGSLAKENDSGSRSRKTKAQQEAPAKTKPRKATSKDRKATSDNSGLVKGRKRTASPREETRDELREPKVPNVRKSKKDVARTDDSGEKTVSRSRAPKSKTQ